MYVMHMHVSKGRGNTPSVPGESVSKIFGRTDQDPFQALLESKPVCHSLSRLCTIGQVIA